MADVGRARDARGGWKGEMDLEPGQQDEGWRESGFTEVQGLKMWVEWGLGHRLEGEDRGRGGDLSA